MPIEIKVNTAERLRRVRQANPSISDSELKEKFGVTTGQIKAAFAYKQPGQKPGRERA